MIEQETKIEVGAIFAAAEKITGLSASAITGQCRSKNHLRARFAVVLVIHEMRGDATLERIGGWMDRDHSSVIHALRRAKDCYAADPTFAATVEAIRHAALSRPVESPGAAARDLMGRHGGKAKRPPTAMLRASLIPAPAEDADGDPPETVLMRREGNLAAARMAMLLRGEAA